MQNELMISEEWNTFTVKDEKTGDIFWVEPSLQNDTIYDILNKPGVHKVVSQNCVTRFDELEALEIEVNEDCHQIPVVLSIKNRNKFEH